MEIICDGPICQPLTRGGVPRIDHSHDLEILEITTINKMIQLFCGDLFTPEVLRHSINTDDPNHGISYAKANLEGDNRFIVVLSDIRFNQLLPERNPMRKYCRVCCNISIYDLSNYNHVTFSDIMSGLSIGKFGEPVLGYEHNFHFKRSDFIEHDEVNFFEEQRDWIVNDAYTTRTSQFVENMNEWSRNYISSIEEKEDNSEEEIDYLQSGVMVLAHYNNGKEKDNSHEVTIFDDSIYNIPPHFQKADIWNWNVGDIHGYGATKEEAYIDFITKLKIYFDEFEKFAKTAIETDILEGCMKEVDCFGKEIKK